MGRKKNNVKRVLYNCVRHDEPIERWLTNWRNLHYFEYWDTVTVMSEKDYDKIMAQEALFVRKVRTGVSDGLLDMIDSAGEEKHFIEV